VSKKERRWAIEQVGAHGWTVHHENAKGLPADAVWLWSAPRLAAQDTEQPEPLPREGGLHDPPVLNGSAAGTVTNVRPIRVVLDARFSGEPSYDVLAAMGDALMEALIDAGATDPFVSVDAAAPSLLVEVVVEAESQAGALAAGAAVIDTALRAAGVEKRAAMQGSRARTEDLVSA
jgi:hypothetical protein